MTFNFFTVPMDVEVGILSPTDLEVVAERVTKDLFHDVKLAASSITLAGIFGHPPEQTADEEPNLIFR